MRSDRPMRSEYMHWAKTLQRARFTLAESGMKAVSLAELGATSDDVALAPPFGYGDPRLRDAIASRYGIPRERVVTAAGTAGANHLAMAALIEPGDEVVVEHPVYEPMETLARHLGAVVRHLPRRFENGFRVDPDDARKAVTSRTRLVVLSNLNNPAPAAIDEPTMRAIGAAAEAVGATVLVDEVYLDAAFEAAPPSAAKLGDVFVVTSSLTKVYGLGGLRAGWIVAAPPLAARMWQLKNLFGVDDAHPAERLATFAFGRLGPLAARARGILDANRARWHEFLTERALDLEAELSPIGTTSFPRVVRVDADALARLLRDRYETSIVPGRFFGAPQHVRIGLSGDPEIFAEGTLRFGRALDDLRSGRA